nr:ankyrin repeat-containing protein BDA1-like [Coffea arabica]
MEQILAEAAQSGDINALYHVLREDPTLLDKYDEPSFVDTPAHIAAAAGSTHFAVEVLRLKPSFRAKLNPDGYSPLDLALRRGKNRTVKWLIKHDPELIRVKGREGFTPLHYVAEVGDAELLADLLVACPQSIQDLTIRGETAVHIAVRNKNVRALQVLLGWLKRGNINGQILNWKDENGETALHIAASTNNFEAVKFLMNEVKINEQNFEGLTCLDTFMGLAITGDERIAKALRCAGAKRSSSLRPAKTFADILSSKEPFTRKVFRQMVELDASIDGLSSEMRNALLVVAVLFLTAAYEAVLTPPGGTSSGGNSECFCIFCSLNEHVQLSLLYKSYSSSSLMFQLPNFHLFFNDFVRKMHRNSSNVFLIKLEEHCANFESAYVWDTSPKSVADVVDVYRSSPLDHQSDVDTLVEAHQPNSPSVLDNSTDVPRRGDEKSVLLPV